MKLLAIRAVALAMVAGLPMPAVAADRDGQFALRSLATVTCGQVLERVNTLRGDELQTLVDQMSFWLGGYLTHANRVTPETFDIVPFAVERDVLALIVFRCQSAPAEANFEAVTSEVVTSLSAYAVKDRSPVRSGEMMIPLRELIVVQVQAKLSALGHLKDAPDGVFGQNTEKAVQAFQAAIELPATGKLDIDTVLALLSN